MKTLVSGSTGLVGTALTDLLKSKNHDVVPLVRHAPKPGTNEVQWDPLGKPIDTACLEGVEAVVHLAGENIAGRWTASKKEAIRESRVKGTQTLCKVLGRMAERPKVLVSASAVGYYGNSGDAELTEDAVNGHGFLAEVCKDWEKATELAEKAGIRVVHARLGVVLSAQDGALKKMLFPFKMCAGGKMGNGKQYWSWIDIDDVVAALLHCIETPSLSGPVNLVAPNPATNKEFTKALGRVLGRPTIFPMPGFVAKIVLGEMAKEMLLAGQRVLPKKLQESGFTFRYPELEASLRHALGREEPASAEAA